MPGRFFLASPTDALAAALNLLDGPLDAARRASLATLPRLVPRYNIAPGQDIPIILPPNEPAQRPAMKFARWGLIPHWSATPDVGVRTINIAAETIDETGTTAGMRSWTGAMALFEGVVRIATVVIGEPSRGVHSSHNAAITNGAGARSPGGQKRTR